MNYRFYSTTTLPDGSVIDNDYEDDQIPPNECYILAGNTDAIMTLVYDCDTSVPAFYVCAKESYPGKPMFPLGTTLMLAWLIMHYHTLSEGVFSRINTSQTEYVFLHQFCAF